MIKMFKTWVGIYNCNNVAKHGLVFTIAALLQNMVWYLQLQHGCKTWFGIYNCSIVAKHGLVFTIAALLQNMVWYLQTQHCCNCKYQPMF